MRASAGSARLALVAALAAAALVASLAVAGGAEASHRPVITQAASGKTFRLARGLTLRLSSRWSWTTPKLSSRAIKLTPVMYVLDPGFSEWEITVGTGGKATIRSAGRPACTGCAVTPRSFVVTILAS